MTHLRSVELKERMGYPLCRNKTMGLTTSSAARVLGVSAQTVIEWSAAGLLHPVRSAAGWRYFDPREVEKLATARQKKYATADRQ